MIASIDDTQGIIAIAAGAVAIEPGQEPLATSGRVLT